MTTMKETTVFGLFRDGYEASYGKGHRGEGNTPEEAKARLQNSRILATAAWELPPTDMMSAKSTDVAAAPKTPNRSGEIRRIEQ